MEFQYRAVDERRSRSPPPPPAPSTSSSGSADGDGPAEHVGHSAVTLWQPALPLPAAAAEADEVRRQAEKARIRERILREEAEQWELELEVRREMREQMLRLSWPPLSRSSAMGSDAAAAPSPGATIAANWALPAVVNAHEAHQKANAVAAVSAKRKGHDHAATASAVSLAASSKKQKITLTCDVCGISANSEKTMQDHLNGKVHKKKAVALPELPKLGPETEKGRELEAEEEEVMAVEILGDYKPTKFMMATTAGVLNEVTQMDGYILCELCNVRTTDRITMMCHLQGGKHISKGQKNSEASSKPSYEEGGTVTAAKECVQGISNSAIANADPEKLLVEDDVGVPLPNTVRRSEGFLLCELCDVKATSMNGMREHLSGKKHKNKAKAITDARVNVSTGETEAAKAQPKDTNMVRNQGLVSEPK